MTQTRALIAVFVAMVVLLVVASVGLRLLDAKEDVVATVLIFISCGAAFAVSAVVGHYEPDEPKR